MRYFYSILFYLALPFIFLRLLWRSRKAPAYRHRLGERLGFCPYPLSNCIWVHAVSMGETIAAIPLIKKLQSHYPTQKILVTNMTPTGSARVKAALGDSVFNCYIPYDIPSAVTRFLNRINPKMVIVMETELWPNLFAQCEKRKIPIIVTNARLSEKSASGYRKILSLTKKMLLGVNKLASQGHADAERFVALGLPQERIKVTGNIKFDIELPGDIHEKSIMLRTILGKTKLIWVAASTHQGEEEIILAAHKIIQKQFPDSLLVLVPRHPERFEMVASLIQKNNFKMARRSQSSNISTDTSVYLGDSMGEMLLMYAIADVACVAGSFANIGGHNMLEPAVLRKPVITGPVLFNFAEISELMIKAQGMIVVQDANGLAQQVIRFFQDESYRKEVGENAFKVVEINRGALQKQLEMIFSLCPEG